MQGLESEATNQWSIGALDHPCLNDRVQAVVPVALARTEPRVAAEATNHTNWNVQVHVLEEGGVAAGLKGLIGDLISTHVLATVSGVLNDRATVMIVLVSAIEHN